MAKMKWRLQQTGATIETDQDDYWAEVCWARGKHRGGDNLHLYSKSYKTYRGAVNSVLRTAKKLGLPLEAKDFEEED